MTTFFARPDYFYPPYADVYRLAELSGYEVRFLSSVDWDRPDNVIITPANGEFENIPAKRRATAIHWQFERPAPGEAPNPYVDRTWVSDRALAQAINAEYVFFGGHRSFAELRCIDKCFDVVTLLSWFGRRTDLRHEIMNVEHMTLADPAGDCWGDVRHHALTASRTMVSCHQDELKWSEPIRFAIGGMYALPLVSETCADAGLWNGLYLQGTMAELPFLIRGLLSDPVRQARMGAAAWRLVCIEHPFKQCVEEALERVTA